MTGILQTDDYSRWFSKLKDRSGRALILARIRRASLGNFGDAKAVGGGVFEMRIMSGPGYRVYFTQNENDSIVLLVGGDKSTQRADIGKAKRLASRL